MALDGVERGHDAERAIVVHAEVAILRAGVLPRDHEHREALLGQIFHQRILRRQIEDVVFHDPGRHDQDRLGPDLVGRGRILDELDQPVAIDDLAGRHRDVAADLELLGADRLLAADRRAPSPR